jgi:hypothetical protein
MMLMLMLMPTLAQPILAAEVPVACADEQGRRICYRKADIGYLVYCVGSTKYVSMLYITKDTTVTLTVSTGALPFR